MQKYNQRKELTVMNQNTRKKNSRQAVCSVCGTRVAISQSRDYVICEKISCRYFQASERASWWMQKSQELEKLMNNSLTSQHVTKEGVGVKKACNICEKVEVTHGCGRNCLSILCPYCICKSKRCRAKMLKLMLASENEDTYCFSNSCPEVINIKTGSTCVDCKKRGKYPSLYCESHADNQHHVCHNYDWSRWIDGKFLNRSVSNKRKSTNSKPSGIKKTKTFDPADMLNNNPQEFLKPLILKPYINVLGQPIPRMESPELLLDNIFEPSADIPDLLDFEIDMLGI